MVKRESSSLAVSKFVPPGLHLPIGYHCHLDGRNASAESAWEDHSEDGIALVVYSYIVMKDSATAEMCHLVLKYSLCRKLWNSALQPQNG